MSGLFVNSTRCFPPPNISLPQTSPSNPSIMDCFLSALQLCTCSAAVLRIVLHVMLGWSNPGRSSLQASLTQCGEDGGPRSPPPKLACLIPEWRVTGGWRNREKAAFNPKLQAVNCERGDLWRGEWQRCLPPDTHWWCPVSTPEQWGQYGRQGQEPPAVVEDKGHKATCLMQTKMQKVLAFLCKIVSTTMKHTHKEV